MLSNTRSRGVDNESIEVVGAEKVVAMANGEVKDVGDDTEVIFVRRESSKSMLLNLLLSRRAPASSTLDTKESLLGLERSDGS